MLNLCRLIRSLLKGKLKLFADMKLKKKLDIAKTQLEHCKNHLKWFIEAVLDLPDFKVYENINELEYKPGLFIYQKKEGFLYIYNEHEDVIRGVYIADLYLDNLSLLFNVLSNFYKSELFVKPKKDVQ